MAEPITDHKTNGCNDAIEIAPRAECVDLPGLDCPEYTVSYPGGQVVLRFQAGPIGEVGHNGITSEALLAVVLDRTRRFQRGRYQCRENALAITKLEEALMWLSRRTRDRLARGVEGTGTP